MSGDIASRNETTQDNEMLFRLIAYNGAVQIDGSRSQVLWVLHENGQDSGAANARSMPNDTVSFRASSQR